MRVDIVHSLQINLPNNGIIWETASKYPFYKYKKGLFNDSVIFCNNGMFCTSF